MLNNPWNVADASTFLKYCCPECDYQITELYIFEDHATSDHEMSSILFENISGTNEDVNYTDKLQKDFEIPAIKIELKQELNDMLKHDNDFMVDNSDSEEDKKVKNVSRVKRDKNNVNASSKSELEELNVSRGPELQRKFCDYKAKKKEHLNVHLRQEDNELPKFTGKFACHVCDFKTNHNSFLKKHILRQHGEYSHPCHICDFKTHLTTKLDKHLAEEHGISKYTGNLTCNLCDYKTNSNRNLGTHVLRIHGEYTQICHICDFKTHLVMELDEHLLKDHDISKYKGEFVCHVCDFKTDNNRNLNKHLFKLHGEYTHPCHLCDFKTYQPRKLDEHCSKEHGISKFSGEFACHVCDFKTDDRSNLNKHVKRIHNEESQESYSCDICEFKANLVAEVRKHLYDEHGVSSYSGDQKKGPQRDKEFDEKKKFMCHHCDFRTRYNNSLQNHLRLIHKEHIPKRKRSLNWKKSLKANWNNCHLCDFKSKFNSNLRNHVARIHGNSEVANIKKQEGKDESMEKLQSEKEGVDFMDVTVTPDIKVENEPKILEKQSGGKDIRDGLCPHCGEVC